METYISTFSIFTTTQPDLVYSQKSENHREKHMCRVKMKGEISFEDSS